MTTKPYKEPSTAEEYLGVSMGAIQRADLAKLLLSMLARINQLEADVAKLWRERP